MIGIMRQLDHFFKTDCQISQNTISFTLSRMFYIKYLGRYQNADFLFKKNADPVFKINADS